MVLLPLHILQLLLASYASYMQTRVKVDLDISPVFGENSPLRDDLAALQTVKAMIWSQSDDLDSSPVFFSRSIWTFRQCSAKIHRFATREKRCDDMLLLSWKSEFSGKPIPMLR